MEQCRILINYCPFPDELTHNLMEGQRRAARDLPCVLHARNGSEQADHAECDLLICDLIVIQFSQSPVWHLATTYHILVSAAHMTHRHLIDCRMRAYHWIEWKRSK